MYNVLVDGTLSYSKTIQKLIPSLDESEVFVNFSVKMCQKVAAKLLFGRGRPANQLQRDLCLFDNNVFPFLLEFLVPTLFRRKVGLGLGFRRRHFSMNRLKDANWPSREVHKDFRI